MYKNYAKLLCNPRLVAHMNRIKSKVYKKVGTLEALYRVEKEPIAFDEKANNLRPIKKGQKWGNTFDCAWFNFKGTVPASAKGQKVVLLIHLDGEGCLFDDEGTPIKGLSNICGAVDAFQPAKAKKVLEVTENAVGGEEIDIWVEAGHNKLSINLRNYAKLKQADIAVMREDINALYYDYMTLLFQLIMLDKNSPKRKSIHSSLDTVLKIAGDFAPDKVSLAREALAGEMKNGQPSPYTFYATGHAHLDLAWLWPIRETKRKVGRTFSNTIHNLEKYPDYIFGVSQPQQLEWLKSLYPKLYDKVKFAILNDRIEPQGRMWTECDTNVPCGESLIRQNVYGERFWQAEYGKSSKICWLPDVFGFSGNLPQILQKCGMDYFLTIKLSWNEHNVFPHRTFIWEGIDNSSVLVHMPPEGNYNSDGTPVALHYAVSKNTEREFIKEMSLPFGIGDGGGGPGEGHIESIIRQQDIAESPIAKFAPAKDLFAKLEAQREKLPAHKGELYLEKHQGTLTSQAKNKYYNRLTEKNLHNLEFLATLAHIKNGEEYPYDMLDDIWKETLLYQFHDIIPGSSIKRVYDESVARYQQINDELVAKQQAILKSFGSKHSLCAVNTTSYERRETLKLGEKYYEAVVPPYGSAKLEEISAPNLDTMETDILKVEFGENGQITSLFNKQLNKEFCGDYLNLLCVYKDKKLYYNAWDIDIKYTKKQPDFFTLVGYQEYQEGNSIIRENLYKYNKSLLTQRIILTMGQPCVEFDNNIEWQETHKMLRAEFAPSVFADEVTCDIQFGNIKRSTRNETSIEKAQFEIAAHKWVDVSSQGYGISLLNDCKYGHRVKDGVISLNLLRSPMWPAKDADKGMHSFRYALYPHAGDCIEANTAKVAYAFNYPLIVTNLPFGSFISSSDNNIVIETVKMAENRENEIIIRAYEDSGTARTASISIDTEYKKCMLTDMLENEIAECSLSELSFTPFEIKTIKVVL